MDSSAALPTTGVPATTGIPSPRPPPTHTQEGHPILCMVPPSSSFALMATGQEDLDSSLCGIDSGDTTHHGSIHALVKGPGGGAPSTPRSSVQHDLLRDDAGRYDGSEASLDPQQCGLLLLLTILTWCISRIQLILHSSSSSRQSGCNCNHNPPNKAKATTPAQPVIAGEQAMKRGHKKEGDKVTSEDIKVVMRSVLGLSFDHDQSSVPSCSAASSSSRQSSCNCNHNPPNKAKATTPAQPVLAGEQAVKTGHKKEGDKVTSEDIKVVMRSVLGLSFDHDQSSVPSCGAAAISIDDLPRLFDDDEPSLHEVRHAFLVFDEDREGYLDASDLQRVFRSLGFRVGAVGLGECEQMISRYDFNTDGRIDLVEFTRVLEDSIC